MIRRPAAARLDIEQCSAIRFPTDPFASPSGATFAWPFQRARRTPILRRRRPLGFRALRIATYEEDDGQELTDLSFTDDDETLIDDVRRGDQERTVRVQSSTTSVVARATSAERPSTSTGNTQGRRAHRPDTPTTARGTGRPRERTWPDRARLHRSRRHPRRPARACHIVQMPYCVFVSTLWPASLSVNRMLPRWCASCARK